MFQPPYSPTDISHQNLPHPKVEKSKTHPFAQTAQRADSITAIAREDNERRRNGTGSKTPGEVYAAVSGNN